MVSKEKIEEDFVRLLKEANPDAVVEKRDIDIFSQECNVDPRDMLYVFMELKQKYHRIDYNALIDKLEIYSINNIVLSIWLQINDK